MTNPRILLTPTMTEMEWPIRPLIEEWAEVASYDAPGVGGQPPPETYDRDVLVDRLVAEVERLEWERFVLVGDEWGAVIATLAVEYIGERLAGLALGHATLRFDRAGESAGINGEVLDGLFQFARADYQAYTHAMSQTTGMSYGPEFMDEYIERVPKEVLLGYAEILGEMFTGQDLAFPLRELDAPMLLAEHTGCLLWTPEGFREAVKAFPDATTISTDLKPSVSPEFAAALKDFCLGLPG